MPTARSRNGMIVTPHRLASQAGLHILREGGNAVEAAVAAAADLGVVYPHMTGLGGDGFWLILPHNARTPLFIDACGRSAALASPAWYARHGHTALPKRGPQAALTVAGAVSGWAKALALAASWPQKRGHPLPLSRLLEAAVHHAEQGYPITASQHELTNAFLPELAAQPGFAEHFLENGKPPPAAGTFRLPALANTLRLLAKRGLDDFYRGDCARNMAADLEKGDSPLRPSDLAGQEAELRPALRLPLTGCNGMPGKAALRSGTLFNSPPPTQGLASLLMLGLLERFVARTGCDLRDETMLVHALVEATKQAFLLRDRCIADPAHMARNAESLLKPELLDALAVAMRADAALSWPLRAGEEDSAVRALLALERRNASALQPEKAEEENEGSLPGREHPAQQPGGDTVWLGAMDAHGNVVSYIQSLYHEFGSGFVLPESGIAWQNRGLGFTLAPDTPNTLAPGKKPFHTLNPALALLDDGRILAYGTMGGEGQPQTQAAVFTRYAHLGMDLQHAISAPRWLLGRAWGDPSPDLKLEADFPPDLFQRLAELGHTVRSVPALSSLMGHAGALVRHPDGLLEGAADPRSDGSAEGR